jgi:hypothetical protein
MADDDEDRGSGFGWGLVVGLAVGVVVGAFLAWGPGREQMAELRDRTIELGEGARRAAANPESPLRRALQEGLAAARRRRAELERQAGASNLTELDPDA